jgi:hypothetical protein
VPGVVRKGRPPRVQAQFIVGTGLQAVALQDVDATRCLQSVWRRLGAEAEIEVDHHAAGDHVARAGAAVDVAHLPAGGWEEGIALVPDGGGQFGQRRRHEVDRVARQVWVGNVALDALDRELAAHGAAAAVLDHVASAFDRGGLADDAPVQPLAACFQSVADNDRAVVGWPFLVTGEQKGDVDRWCGVGGRNSSQATTMAASEAFMSLAPRP